MKRRCDKIFSVVNYNQCVGKIFSTPKKYTQNQQKSRKKYNN